MFIPLAMLKTKLSKNSFSPPPPPFSLSHVLVEVSRVFGNNIKEYAIRLSQGVFDYVMKVPKPLLLYVASFLELEDVARLSGTCKTFYEVSMGGMDATFVFSLLLLKCHSVTYLPFNFSFSFTSSSFHNSKINFLK